MPVIVTEMKLPSQRFGGRAEDLVARRNAGSLENIPLERIDLHYILLLKGKRLSH
jgi:hypothetical protein